MFKKDQDIVLVHCDEEAVRVVHMRRASDEQKVIDVARRDARDTAPEELSKLVSSAFDEIHCKKIRAVCLVPSKAVITKNIEIPSLDPQEIRSIIDLQAGRHTPYSREDIIVGYVTIGTFQRNYTKVLLVIVNREVIKKQIALYQQAGVKIDKIIFAPEGIAQYYARGMNIKPDDVPVGIINIAKNSTDFSVEFNRTVATYRHIPVGLSQLIKDGADARQKLLAELTKSIEAYQNEDINKLPETFVLTSDDAKIKELQPVLQEQLKSNVKVVAYLDWIKANQPVMLKFVSEYNDESFLDCIAGAATCDALQVDLTPDEIKTQRTIEEKGRQVIQTGVLAVVLLLLFCGVFFSKLYFRSVYLGKVEERYIEQRKSVEVLDRVARKTRIVKDYINSRMVDLNILEELYHLIPNEIYLESVIVNEDGTIQIQGVSESMSRVFNFVSALEESELFKRVKTKSTTAKKERGKDVAAFEISFMLESAKEIPEEEAVAEEGAPPPEAEAPKAEGKAK